MQLSRYPPTTIPAVAMRRSATAAIAAALRVWLRRQRTRRQLRALEARELCDMGIAERERRRECDKWPWQA
jgi:uncharacterized protein YjiS (DUF1127 family)